jgi:hypothetical protein
LPAVASVICLIRVGHWLANAGPASKPNIARAIIRFFIQFTSSHREGRNHRSSGGLKKSDERQPESDLEEPPDVKGGWTATASVDCGSGRPANGTPREALPQCAATAPPKTSRGTASYCMARPARGKSTPVCESSASGPQKSTASDRCSRCSRFASALHRYRYLGVPRSGLQRGVPCLSVHIGLERRGVPSAAWDSGRWGSGGYGRKDRQGYARIRREAIVRES